MWTSGAWSRRSGGTPVFGRLLRRADGGWNFLHPGPRGIKRALSQDGHHSASTPIHNPATLWVILLASLPGCILTDRARTGRPAGQSGTAYRSAALCASQMSRQDH